MYRSIGCPSGAEEYNSSQSFRAYLLFADILYGKWGSPVRGLLGIISFLWGRADGFVADRKSLNGPLVLFSVFFIIVIDPVVGLGFSM
jgi:hypothetical protein